MNQNTFAIQKPEYNFHTALPSLRNTGRAAGLLYLVIILAGIAAHFFVRASLIVPGDAIATANNLAANESLFRAGIGLDLVMILSDVAVATAFYLLLRPVSRGLSLLAAFFRLAQATFLGVNLLNLFFALQLLDGAPYLAVLGVEPARALALFFLEAHALGYSIGLVFFGFSILLLGFLILRSNYIPRLLGLLLMVAAAGYVIDSFAVTLLVNYADYADLMGTVVFAPALVAELAVAVWLIIKGVKVPADSQANQPAAG